MDKKKRILEDIAPKELFRFFEELSEIPRGSGKEEKVTDYLIAFARRRGLKWHRDEVFNVLIKKPGTIGYEKHPPLILQAHSDMVCEKNEGTIHDFEKDPIKLQIDGDILTADGTTLGADDGVGVATGLAILDSRTLKHPPIEFVITSDEERGMIGVETFDTGLLKGRRMINLDSAGEDTFVVGCAGGPGVLTTFPVVREEVAKGFVPVTVKILGLRGGHSGEDIHRGRANSIKLLGRIMRKIIAETESQPVYVKGGMKYNAIPREAESLLYVAAADLNALKALVKAFESDVKKEYRFTDENVKITVQDSGASHTYMKPMSKGSWNDISDYLTFAPCGVLAQDPNAPGMAESSVSIGILQTDESQVRIHALTRSSLKSSYMETYDIMCRLAERLGGTTSLLSDCPQWEYNPDSELKAMLTETFREVYGKAPKELLLHAGLECGVFDKRMEGPVDLIAIGPDMGELHTPDEWLSLSSTERYWKFLCKAIEKL